MLDVHIIPGAGIMTKEIAKTGKVRKLFDIAADKHNARICRGNDHAMTLIHGDFFDTMRPGSRGPSTLGSWIDRVSRCCR
jgi:hypothetical protein